MASSPEPQVSVVIPARNEAGYVTRALESIAAQTWAAEGIEVIVVDNASTDGTAQAVLAFKARAPRPALRVVTEPRLGTAAAKNRGAHEARGRIVLFLDADSRAAPRLVEAIVRDSGRGVPAGSIRIAADSKDPLDRAFFGLIEWGKGLFRIRAQMLYCERALFLEAGGFDLRLRLAEDREFLVRLQRRGIEVGHVRDAAILTSTRRLHELPLRLGMLRMFARWALAQAGIGRKWRY
jgi:glycosyltransferase involved in cell wall biosynthesis